jgi:hypothetical protein
MNLFFHRLLIFNATSLLQFNLFSPLRVNMIPKKMDF